jgi:PIN domain nuclease of toxin-antitoxin system
VIVLDASVVIAFLKQESGWERIESHLASAALSTVNVAEVLSRYAEIGVDPVFIQQQVEAMECEIVDVTMIHALIVAKLRPLTKALGLSLGDRTCLALAIERDCPAMTADRNWAKLNIGVPIQLIR